MREPLLEELVDALRILPGVGAKTAQRMAFHLLERDREGGINLIQVLDRALKAVQLCDRCRMLTTQSLCGYCTSPKRKKTMLCVVKSPADAVAIESSGTYLGQYFVLHGHLSPIEGIGPQQLGIELLVKRVDEEEIDELIFATHPTTEGDTTALHISECMKGKNVLITRLSRGVPAGGELEYVDTETLGYAMASRGEFSFDNR